MGRFYLTVAREKRLPQNDGYVAVISDGSPQNGDQNVTILSVNVVKNMKAARQWFDKMIDEQPWLARQ